MNLSAQSAAVDPRSGSDTSPPVFVEPETQAVSSRKMALLNQVRMLARILDAMPCMTAVLDGRRQIVAANEQLLAMVHATSSEVEAMQPGAVFGCIHVEEGPAGCGTSRHCAVCGVLRTVLDCEARKEKSTRNCRLTVKSPTGFTPLDLRVTASPLQVGDAQFAVVSIEDVSQATRLEVMQRTFFHDVLNSVGCMRGYVDLLRDHDADSDEFLGRLARLSDDVLEAIQSHRDLVEAEAGDFIPRKEAVCVRGLLEDLGAVYSRHSVATGRTIRHWCGFQGMVTSDRRLLFRVLGNMLKNALEATPTGGEVTITCQRQNDCVEFAVHNAQYMPDDVQIQVFQRSFSTKGGSGRGLGTYSMKLFGETYLQGKVSFTSNPLDGTTFRLAFPVS